MLTPNVNEKLRKLGKAKNQAWKLAQLSKLAATIKTLIRRGFYRYKPMNLLFILVLVDMKFFEVAELQGCYQLLWSDDFLDSITREIKPEITYPY